MKRNLELLGRDILEIARHGCVVVFPGRAQALAREMKVASVSAVHVHAHVEESAHVHVIRTRAGVLEVKAVT
jgi:hypothetical protein